MIEKRRRLCGILIQFIGWKSYVAKISWSMVVLFGKYVASFDRPTLFNYFMLTQFLSNGSTFDSTAKRSNCMNISGAPPISKTQDKHSDTIFDQSKIYK